MEKSLLLQRNILLFVLLVVLGTDSGGLQAFDYNHVLWNQVLKGYSHEGRVDYKGLKIRPEGLEDYLDSLGAVKELDYNSWNREDKNAFWINAYNALTIKAIIDHYPIKPSGIRSLRFPKNSIRQIPDVWDKLKFRIIGREITLDEIEHGILRKEFKEPRVHMALVCASWGCPPLRSEAFVGATLDSQLDDQAKLFLHDQSKFRIDRNAGIVYLSPIFKWFGGDFVEKYTTANGFPNRDTSEKAVLNFISKYLDEGDRQYLSSSRFKINYLDYDWSLNES